MMIIHTNLRVQNSVVRLKYTSRHFNGSRFKRQQNVRIAGLNFQLYEDPNVVRELQGLIKHVLTLDVPLCYCENVVLLHF